jgi:hypothetical protein
MSIGWMITMRRPALGLLPNVPDNYHGTHHTTHATTPSKEGRFGKDRRKAQDKVKTKAKRK